MAKFKVLQPIQHDSKKLKIGDEIELTEEESAALLKLEAIEPSQEIAPVIIEQAVTTKTAKIELPKA